MCSIEEAWAGQNFAGKRVSSQSDIHDAYMSLPDNLLNRNNNFLPNTSEPKSRDFIRGINSKYSREPRVPMMQRNAPEGNFEISSTTHPLDNYGGVHPSSKYMEFGVNSIEPATAMGKDLFSDINNAFTVSKAVDHFMERGMENRMLDEDTEEERMIINNKYANMNNNSGLRNNETNMENANGGRMNNNIVEKFDDITDIKSALQIVLTTLDRLENQLHNNQSRNSYDIALYILIGMLVSFVLLSLWSNMRR
jgi:hypothetical protein